MKDELIIIDLCSADESSLTGKDLAKTNAPMSDLLEIANNLSSLEEDGPAEGLFVQQVRQRGFEMELVSCIEDMPIIKVEHSEKKHTQISLESDYTEKCPVCSSEDIELDHDTFYEKGKYQSTHFCWECNASWKEHFRAYKVELVKDGNVQDTRQ